MTDLADHIPIAAGDATGSGAAATRRAHILAAAAACFARAGFHGTSMQEVCQEAKMSPGAVYRYFRSKDDIIRAIAEDERARKLDLLHEPPKATSFVDHLMELGGRFLCETAPPGKAALMAEVMAECLRNSDIGQLFRANEQLSREAFRALTEAAVERGEIRPPDDFDAVMSSLMAIGEGLALRMAADPTLTFERIAPIMRRIALSLFPPADPAATEPKSF